MLRLLRVRLIPLMRREEGNVMIMVALSIFLLVISVGVAIDMVRAQTLRARMQYALDAGGLAAAATAGQHPNTMTIDQWVLLQATRYFNADFATGYLQSTLVTPTTHLTDVRTQNILEPGLIIDLTANTTQTTDFMHVAGITSVPVGVTSQAKLRIGIAMELVVVADVSTPMNQPIPGDIFPRVQEEKGQIFVLHDVLFGNGPRVVPGMYMSLVPFAGTVNIGTGHPGWKDSADPHQFPSWAGCLMARPSPYDTTDDPPSVSPFDEFNNPDYSDHNTGCPLQIIPMTNQWDVFSIPEQNLAVPVTPSGTDTFIDGGMAWAWALLSPRWNGLWGGEMDAPIRLPLPYHDDPKVVILISGSGNVFQPGIFTAYGHLDDGLLGTTDPAVAAGILDTRTLSICTGMKNNGVIIYAVAFSATDISVLQNCATDSSHYFFAPTLPEFFSAMNQIGDQLTALRLSQ